MRTIVGAILAMACGLTAAAPVRALDLTIPAKVGMVKPGKMAKLVSKPATPFGLPAPGSADDPTQGGAQLTFFDTALGGAGSAAFTLGAAGWTGLGNPAGSKGYKYKGGDDTPAGACSVVLVKRTVIKAVCKGVAVTIMPPFASTLGVNLALPAGTATARRYCAELGGSEARNDASQLKRTDAPAPGACAAVPTAFDAGDLLALAADALQGRNNNTPGSAAAQAYLIGELQAMGAAGLDSGQSGDAAYKQPFVQSGQSGTNILAVIPGSELPNEYVIVGAHYDHLASCRTVEAGDTVCNGATDNAAGVTAALAIGRGIAALPTPPRRSVVIALWDAEEDGLLGSLYYVNHPLVPLANTVTYVNFDIQGANLLPSLRDVTFAVGAETGSGLGALVGPAAAGVSLQERQLSYIFGQGRSDYVNFVGKNVPTIFYSDSTGPCYHTNQDEPAVVDFGKLEQQTRRAYDLTVTLANTASPPTFVAPSSALATFGDAVILDEVLTAGLADLALFSPADQAALSSDQAAIHAIVAAGAGSFDGSDVTTLLVSTVDVINLLTRTACDGFLAP
ncbi:MAG: M28 family peptidase [Candidatus Binatia bacterium]